MSLLIILSRSLRRFPRRSSSSRALSASSSAEDDEASDDSDVVSRLEGPGVKRGRADRGTADGFWVRVAVNSSSGLLLPVGGEVDDAVVLVGVGAAEVRPDRAARVVGVPPKAR